MRVVFESKSNNNKVRIKQNMKKLMITALVSASVFCSVQGVEFRKMKLGDTLYNQEESDEAMRPFRQSTSVRDDTWYITYQHQQNHEGLTSENSDVVTNDIGKVIASVTTTTSYPSQATLTPKSDGFVYPPITWRCADSGASFTNDTLYVSTPGMYKVTGKDTQDREASCEIPFSYRTDVSTTYSQYIADTNANRNALISEFIDVCMNSNLVNYVFTSEGGTVCSNNEIQAFICPHAWTATQKTAAYRGGNVWPWAISPHVMASAWHYSWSRGWSGTVTLTNKVDGGTFTVHKSAPWINAAEWAKANGWTADEVSTMGISDIALIVIDSGEIPSSCCPYFTDVETIKEVFGNLTGLPCWTYTQNATIYCDPGIYGSDYGQSYGIGFHWRETKSTTYRLDILNLLGAKDWNLWTVCGGDSGRSIFFRWKGQNVITSSYTSAGGGASYIKGFEVIKAFCAAHGDTIKEMVK